jgi:SAM-dependent methyltransferase
MKENRPWLHSVLSDTDRLALRATFGQAADSYDRARPEYPAELYADLIAATGIEPGDPLLEVGCATGKATRPLAARGYRITCVELGEELAAGARVNLAPWDVEVVRGRFEDWDRGGFALVYAATAWHWIDPEVRYRRAWETLRAGGHLAFWGATHVRPEEGGDPFFDQIQRTYEEIGDSMPAGTTWPRPGKLPEGREQITETGLFDIALIRQYDWEVEYTAEEYIALLSTFSGHIAMREWQRERLFGEVRRLLGARKVRRHWGAVLHVARRRLAQDRRPPGRIGYRLFQQAVAAPLAQPDQFLAGHAAAVADPGDQGVLGEREPAGHADRDRGRDRYPGVRQPAQQPAGEYRPDVPVQAAELPIRAHHREIEPRAVLDHGGERAEGGVQLRGRAQRAVGLHLREQFPGRRLDDGLAELPLGAEVMEQQPGRDTDPGGHRLDRHVLDRMGLQHGRRRREDLPAPVTGGEPPAIRCGLAHARHSIDFHSTTSTVELRSTTSRRGHGT